MEDLEKLLDKAAFEYVQAHTWKNVNTLGTVIRDWMVTYSEYIIAKLFRRLAIAVIVSMLWGMVAGYFIGALVVKSWGGG